jgi:hypothetical protein
MPDVLLWNPGTNELWVIEAATSDGEVDAHKVCASTFMSPRVRWLAGRARQAL